MPPPEWWTHEDDNAHQLVYLVTFAKILNNTAEVAEPPLRDVAALSREDISKALQDAVANPSSAGPRRGGRPRTRPLAIDKMVVFKEMPGPHFHVALKLSCDSRWLPFKEALRLRSQLASHWSTSHTMWWSAVRYGAAATPRKQTVDDAPLAWTPDGRELNLYEESQEPFVAKAWKRRREQKELGAEGVAKQGKGGIATFAKIDFIALVLAESLTTPAAVMAYAKACSSALVQAFVVRHQARLPQYLADAQAWATAEEARSFEAETSWARVQRYAKGTCSCPGGLCQWWAVADDFLQRNAQTIDRAHLAATLARIIQDGPSKTARVPLIVGPTNSGKSTLLEPLDGLFGFKKVLHTPSMKGSSPLANLMKGKRFIFWDDYRPVEYAASGAVPVITFLKLFSGQHTEIQVSQSFNDGNPDIQWTGGAAMTAKLDGLWDPVAPICREDIRHMRSRVEEFRAMVPLPAGSLQAVPRCPESFARWLVVEAGAFALRRVATPQLRVVGRKPPALPAEASGEPGDAE